MYIQDLIKLSLIVSSLSLAGCGGSDSNEPTPVIVPNLAPSVSIAPNTASAIEKATFSVSAVATDSDGTIASYQWKVISSHTLVLAGEMTSSVSFMAPDVGLSGDTVQLEVTATDDDGAKSTASTSILINAKTIPLTIKGLATDSPLSNAKISAHIAGRDISVEAIAENDGKYSVDLLLDDAEASSFISISARGVSQQSNAGLISLLGTAEELSTIAGDDNVLTSAEHFAVNVTNITTAKYAFAKRANSGKDITTTALLESLYAGLNYDEVMMLATAIKVAIDKSAANNTLSLPEGIPDTLSLVENAAKAKAYVEMVQSAPEYTEAQQEIYQDTNLVDADSDFNVPAKYYVLPADSLSRGDGFDFMPNGKGSSKDLTFDWTESNGEITATIVGQDIKTFKTQESIYGRMTYVKVQNLIDKIQFKRLSSSTKSDLLLITWTNRRHYPNAELTDEISTSTSISVAVKEAGIIPIEPMTAGFASLTIDEEIIDGDISVEADLFTLTANGQGSRELLNDNFTWKVEQGALFITLENGKKLRFRKISDAGVADIFSYESSEDGINFTTNIMGQGKISPKRAWTAAEVAGIYDYTNNQFDSGDLSHFWIELQTNGDAETYSAIDSNENGEISTNELFIAYGKWKIEDDGSLTITRVRKQDGNYSPKCRDAATTGCTLYHERNWRLFANKDNAYGLHQKQHFYRSNFSSNNNTLDTIWYGNRTFFKLKTRPVDIDQLPSQ
ncbi:hypothetical protein Sden_0686 [Shewanella denitrificans OS217]|jgi:hypothetical protein|uniref:PKD/Chitinase domain-containing protein n=1 Tax=Shewanella denitrificans (strain OS217 / ATCC BAA-1090 / DSM 15013) TaxID=318161 RepID=Q12RF0_SHEDO|nr:hypothetical protein [Shewanella denitrificans]ABE53976.1 hypothetical protein Sden_0686 [Shewanella denitrificans OS217]